MAKRYVESADAVELDWAALAEMDQGGCYLVALPWAGLSVLLSLLRYAQWRARWREVDSTEWSDVEDFIEELEACLIMGCDVRDLIDTINGSSNRLALELSRMNFNLDRIRDNLDSLAPDGEAYQEYGLANILAAIGPNLTRLDHSLTNISNAVNSVYGTVPNETSELTEPSTPALDDTGIVQSFSASKTSTDIVITTNVTGGTIWVLILIWSSPSWELIFTDTQLTAGHDTFTYSIADYNLPAAGYVSVLARGSQMTAPSVSY